MALLSLAIAEMTAGIADIGAAPGGVIPIDAIALAMFCIVSPVII
jgi:hypothetical protein